MTARDDWGVADGWHGTDGGWHPVAETTREALLAAQGASDPAEAAALRSAQEPVWFVAAGDAPALASPCELTLDSGDQLELPTGLPPDLPLGAHRLRPHDGGPVTQLFVVPRRAPHPPRSWGWSAQLYAARSASSWGMGDLSDLASLARWATSSGASVLAHNPLGATLPLARQEPSPYYASSRRFWSPLYLRVEATLGSDRAQGAVDPAARAGRDLNSDPLIDRDEVWRLKLGALESIWESIRGSEELNRRLDAAGEDDELVRFATFCAIAEEQRSAWPSWPRDLRHPRSPAVEDHRRRNPQRVRFFQWLQIECDAQLGAASTSGAELMADLPVGFDPGGFDAWNDQDLLALDCTVGAPPDDFSPSGQRWGLPPYVPWKLRGAGYAPWLDTLGRVMRHAGALRIDHVMGLFRLFWIPATAEPGEGGYVYQYGSELLDLAVMEAVRSDTVLVGEDLGTVEPDVRSALAERDVFGYRIGWFAEDPPEDWPANTLASLTTHDLPTVAGIVDGQDAEDRAAAGVDPDPAGDSLLHSRLLSLAERSTLDRGDPRSPRSISLRAHDVLARSGSDLAVATLEDAVGARRRPNLPGTVEEHPNWRLALDVPIEELDRVGAGDVAALMRSGRPPVA